LYAVSRRLHLRLANPTDVVNDLTLQIAFFYDTQINDADLSDADCGKIKRDGGSETSDADCEHASCLEARLSGAPDAWTHQATRISPHFVRSQRISKHFAHGLTGHRNQYLDTISLSSHGKSAVHSRAVQVQPQYVIQLSTLVQTMEVRHRPISHFDIKSCANTIY
jgi:hypothetical protein